MDKFEISLRSGDVVELDMSIFEVDSEKQMVNLTKIAKACGARLQEWKESPKTVELISAINEANGNSVSCLVTENGNGTWGNREVALDYAMWISPRFKVWCIKALDELFQNGKVELKPMSDDEMFIMVMSKLQARVEAERSAKEEAIRTKAEIGSRREATSMNTASIAVKKANKLEQELDRSKEYATVKRMSLLYHGQAFDWRLLKSTSIEMDIEPISVFDQNYGSVKAYHRDVWMEAYSLSF